MSCYETHEKRNSIEENPPYQRSGGAWNLAKRQLLIDSLLEGYDIPKIYFHDLGAGCLPRYSIVDGKQRLQAIWDFIENKFSLSNENHSLFFKDLSESSRMRLLGSNLPIVNITDAGLDEIESLFLRLNNGVALSPAERRNGISGDMTNLIRETSRHKFFTEWITLNSSKANHLQLSTYLLLIEFQALRGRDPVTDCKDKPLTALVTDNKMLSEDDTNKLSKAVNKNLKMMTQVFDKRSPFLKKISHIHHYYLVTRKVSADYTCNKPVASVLSVAFEAFAEALEENKRLPSEQRKGSLIAFNESLIQATQSADGIRTRVNTLVEFVLTENPDLTRFDPDRSFTAEERQILWTRAGKKCNSCKRKIPNLSAMHADHIVPWSKGGSTNLANGQCLCGPCNLKKSS